MFANRNLDMLSSESGDDGAALAEPPDPDIVEIDPTGRYIRVTLPFVFIPGTYLILAMFMQPFFFRPSLSMAY